MSLYLLIFLYLLTWKHYLQPGMSSEWTNLVVPKIIINQSEQLPLHKLSIFDVPDRTACFTYIYSTVYTVHVWVSCIDYWWHRVDRVLGFFLVVRIGTFPHPEAACHVQSVNTSRMVASLSLPSRFPQYSVLGRDNDPPESSFYLVSWEMRCTHASR
jgi:hypothetical protein